MCVIVKEIGEDRKREYSREDDLEPASLSGSSRCHGAVILPLPLSDMVCVELPALSLTVSVSGPTGPDAAGLKVTPNLQLLPGAIHCPTQVCAAANVPDPVTELTSIHACFPFATAMVTSLGLLVVPLPAHC